MTDCGFTDLRIPEFNVSRRFLVFKKVVFGFYHLGCSRREFRLFVPAGHLKTKALLMHKVFTVLIGKEPLMKR